MDFGLIVALIYFCVSAPLAVVGALTLYVVFRAWRASEEAR